MSDDPIQQDAAALPTTTEVEVTEPVLIAPPAPPAVKKPSLFITNAPKPTLRKQPIEPALKTAPATGLTQEQLRQRLEQDQEDGEAWLALIADAEKKGDLESTREVYESFLAIFPDNVRF
jgi:cleavage stimulation factor subunit 3